MSFLLGVLIGATPAYLALKKKKKKETVASSDKEEGNRPANLKELQEAKRELFWMQSKSESNLIDAHIAAYLDKPAKAYADPSFPMVVTDFTADIQSNVILVPPGTYTVPLDFMNEVRYFVGLKTETGELPKLYLEGETEEVVNSDTHEKTELHMFEPLNPCVFSNVQLMAKEPTIIKVSETDNNLFFEKHFWKVKFSPNVDAINSENIYLHGRSWAKKSFGSQYSERPDLCKVLESTFEKITKPLCALDKSLDSTIDKCNRFLSLH